MIKIDYYRKLSRIDILSRDEQKSEVTETVAGIIAEVKARGDAALRDFTERFDGARLEAIELTEAERVDAMAETDSGLVQILNEAAENIRSYHSRQVRGGYEISDREGIVLGQKVMPLERVGLYVPGGTASYPSTVLMNCIPAKLAGVREIIMLTPPNKDGSLAPSIIAAAEITGVDRIFKCGGAQAIAALAYGTESVPKVDKIVGPGNAYVAEAKRQVYGKVDIDMIAGPSEILVIADGKSNPAVIAADMLSQAEHDKQATALLLTESEGLAALVANELEMQLSKLHREEIARESIENNGRIIIVESIEEAIEISNEIAPEHLELCVDNPFYYLDAIKNAGSIFLGRYCPEALGDYFAGTNHTLPTGGTARFSSPLSVDDFVKTSSYMFYSHEALSDVSDKIAKFALSEGLSGHAKSATIRFSKEESK